MTKTYIGVGSIIKDWEDLASPGRFYGKEAVSKNNIGTIELTLYTKKDVTDYIEENKRIIPEQLAGKGYIPWLDSATVQGIIENKIEFDENATEEEIVAAIFYYIEKDTYMHE